MGAIVSVHQFLTDYQHSGTNIFRTSAAEVRLNDKKKWARASENRRNERLFMGFATAALSRELVAASYDYIGCAYEARIFSILLFSSFGSMYDFCSFHSGREAPPVMRRAARWYVK